MAQNPDVVAPGLELTYLIKRVEFLGREVPVIVQNKNGPCPLLAIANVLLLRNHFQLHKNAGEITETRLMSLVAERLLDTNLNVLGKDDAYVRNQQQNISDAIALLPRLATGIDVNVRFRNILDFEFTSECAIFDLLDISLVHGWLVDPQDEEASAAIGASSYNNLVEKLVDLQCSGVDLDLTRIDSLRSRSGKAIQKTSGSSEIEGGEKDMQAQAAELASSLSAIALDSGQGANERSAGVDKPAESGGSSHSVEGRLDQAEGKARGNGADEEATALAAAIQLSLEKESEAAAMSAEASVKQLEADEDGFVRVSHSDVGSQDSERPLEQLGKEAAFEKVEGAEVAVTSGASEVGGATSGAVDGSSGTTTAGASTENGQSDAATPTEETSIEPALKDADDAVVSSSTPAPEGQEKKAYEGENEPPPEAEAGGDVFVSLQAGEASPSAFESSIEEEGSGGKAEQKKNGRAIQGFLEGTASQLTYHGLVKLHEGIKERELCVFFRNNHFNTMFRYEGQLYILVTDQGYLHQPGLVWEKLSAVDGDTTFVTGSFQLYRPPDDYQPPSESVRNPTSSGQPIDADLQYALALQQEESDLLAAQEVQLAEAAERRRQQEAMQRPPEPQPASKKKSKSSTATGSTSKVGKKKDDKCIVM